VKRYDFYDPLLLYNLKINCSKCKGESKTCAHCKGAGKEPVNLNGLWYPSPAFLVCGGPSVNKIDYKRLAERGVASLGINNAAGHVPCSAWCFLDAPSRFHYGLFLDPKCLTFMPSSKKDQNNIVVKLPDKTFQRLRIRLGNTPSALGYIRNYNPRDCKKENFLTDYYAHACLGNIDTLNKKNIATPLCSILIGLRILHYLGCPRVYILGLDLTRDQETKAFYSFNEYTTKDSNDVYVHPKAKKRRWWRHVLENEMLCNLKTIFKKHNFKVYNCNPDSKCTAFKYVPFEKALKDCKNGIPQEPFDFENYYNKKKIIVGKKLSLKRLKTIQ
jgi:hypothetical protein